MRAARMVRRLMTIVLVGMVSAGCSPVYKVEYTYSEAETSQMKACALECGERRLSCKEEVWLDYRYCVDDLRYDQFRYRHCVSRAADHQDRLPLCTRPMDFCFRPNYSECHDAYAGCYERCGGTVTRTRKCIANCKGADTEDGS